MKHKEIIRKIEQNPIIAAVRDESLLQKAIESTVSTIFLLHASIFNINRMVHAIKDSGKYAMIHIDFLEGIGRDNTAIDYICDVIEPDGIISTKNSNIKYAADRGMFTIQRFFLIDSMSYDTSVKTAHAIKPHMVEVLPGIMPRIIKRISSQLPMPVIAGGLVETKEDVLEILNSGAIATSTGSQELWQL
ncbi:MAG: glycerol-3-phosphate responsive antiterminator [Clostridiaceae bacterium]|nr:glycerol-3-phosphate responsive antiterminator [Clostridiaceae bacterium]